MLTVASFPGLLSGCASGFRSSAFVLRQREFDAVRTVALGAITVNSFDLSNGAITDTNSVAMRVLRAEVGRCFTVLPVSDVPTTKDGSSDPRREALREKGVDAIAYLDLRYGVGRNAAEMEVRLAFFDVGGERLLADAAQPGSWTIYTGTDGVKEFEKALRHAVGTALVGLGLPRTPPILW